METALTKRVYQHAVRYGGEAYAWRTLDAINAAPEERLHKALNEWTPETISAALEPKPVLTREQGAD